MLWVFPEAGPKHVEFIPSRAAVPLPGTPALHSPLAGVFIPQVLLIWRSFPAPWNTWAFNLPHHHFPPSIAGIGHLHYIMCNLESRDLAISLFKILFIFREEGMGGERERETSQCVVASPAPPNGDLACNLGMCTCALTGD